MHLPGDHCGAPPHRDGAVENASDELRTELANRAWTAQAASLVARSPFYAAKFSAAGVSPQAVASVRELEQLPTTDRDEVRKDQSDRPPYGTNLAVGSADVAGSYRTSGSSGAAGVIALTTADLETWTTIGARSYATTGLHAHHTVLTTLATGPFAAGHTHLTVDRIGASRVPILPGDTGAALAALRAGSADTVLTTPSFALHLAAVAGERGVDASDLGVSHLIVGGEAGGGVPAIRERLEAAFAAS